MVETLITFLFLNCEETGLGQGYRHIWHEESSNTTLNAFISKIAPENLGNGVVFVDLSCKLTEFCLSENSGV